MNEVEALAVWALIIMTFAAEHLAHLRVLVSLAVVAVAGFVVGRLLPD